MPSLHTAMLVTNTLVENSLRSRPGPSAVAVTSWPPNVGGRLQARHAPAVTVAVLRSIPFKYTLTVEPSGSLDVPTTQVTLAPIGLPTTGADARTAPTATSARPHVESLMVSPAPLSSSQVSKQLDAIPVALLTATATSNANETLPPAGTSTSADV